MRSGQGVRPFAVSLLGEFLPLPCHILQNSTVTLALGLARHAAAFLGKSPVFGCGFHAGTTRCSTGLFRTHSALCLRNRLRHRNRFRPAQKFCRRTAESCRVLLRRMASANKNPAEWPGRGPWTPATPGEQT
jgi:hypothetical protein